MTRSNTAANSYAAKLKDPRWQKKRLEVLERAGWACEMCGDSESTLHVHHKQYLKGREPWEYDADQLASLCEICHSATHEESDRLLDAMSRLPVDGPLGRDSVARLLCGLTNQRPSWETGSPYWHAGWFVASLLAGVIGGGHLTREEAFRLAAVAQSDPSALAGALRQFASSQSADGVL